MWSCVISKPVLGGAKLKGWKDQRKRASVWTAPLFLNTSNENFGACYSFKRLCIYPTSKHLLIHLHSPSFPFQHQPISMCKRVIPRVSETDPAVCYHKTSWPSNMHIPTSVNLNMKTHRDFQTGPLITIWFPNKRHIKPWLDFPQHRQISHFDIYI